MSDTHMNIVGKFGEEVRILPLSPEDQRYLAHRGIRYVGEMYHVHFDSRGAGSQEIRMRMMRVLNEHLGLDTDLNPIALGWRPQYWDDASFLNELDVLILERYPTPNPPDWKMYPAPHSVRSIQRRYCRMRGIARTLHQAHVYYVGEICGHGKPKKCPPGQQSTGALLENQKMLSAMRSLVHAGAILPPGWSAPAKWKGAWADEIATITREEAEIKEMFERRDTARPTN